MLRDMEELLNTIKNEEIKEYMEEALNCYNANSYKACIILSLIAGMYELHNKIKTLAPSLRSARELDESIKTIINTQKVYEKYMVEQCALEKLGLLSASERETILTYLSIRNRCAHPGGHTSSAEEARAVFAGIIDILLSRPALFGASYKDILITKLKEPLFFPSDTQEMYEQVTKEIYTNIHKTAIIPIVRALVSIIIDENNNDRVQKKNTIIFVAHLFKLADINNNNIIEPIIDNELHTISLFQIIENNISLIDKFSTINRAKLIRKICDYIHNGRDEYDIKTLINKMYIDYYTITKDERIIILQAIISSKKHIRTMDLVYLIKSGKLSTEEFTIIKKQIIDIIKQIDLNVYEERVQISMWISITLQLNEEDVKLELFKKLLEIVDNADFYICNFGITTLIGLDDRLKNEMPTEFKVKFISAIIYRAGGGARDALQVISNGFEKLEMLVQPFIDKLISDNESFNKILNEIWNMDKLTQFFIKVDRIACLGSILDKILSGEFIFYERHTLCKLVRSIESDEKLSLFDDKIKTIRNNKDIYIRRESE